MPKPLKPLLEPRKSPVQARSSASVQAIREAAVQVLLKEGKERLTTRRIADRAGVSVGTLYQYFPNKGALLQAVLRDHLDGVAEALRRSCEEWKGATLDQMANGLVEGFMKAKLRHVETSRALYFISDDVGGAAIARQNAVRNVSALASLLESAPQKLIERPEIVASMVLATMAGVSRRMLETGLGNGELEAMQQGLKTMVRAYLQAVTRIA